MALFIAFFYFFCLKIIMWHLFFLYEFLSTLVGKRTEGSKKKGKVGEKRIEWGIFITNR